MKKHLRKLGPVGTIFTSLCCLGTPVLLAFLTAIGLGFIINDAVLLVMLLIFLPLGLLGLWQSYREHHHSGPFVVNAISSVLLIIFIFVIFVLPLVILAMIGVLFSSFWDYWLRRKYCRC